MAQKKTAAKGNLKKTANKKSVARGKNSKSKQSLKGSRTQGAKGKRNARKRKASSTSSTLFNQISDRITDFASGIGNAIGFDKSPKHTIGKGRGGGKKSTAGSGKKSKEAKRKMADNDEIKPADRGESSKLTEFSDPDIIQEISWSQQVSSIIFGILALLMFALIVFKGDNLWTVMHNFIFGLFGNMAILWNALLVYSGYMFAKQKGSHILEITRSAAGIIIFADVLNYIMIQSNGYRNTYNELTYSIFDLAAQIYRDGSQLGGTGLIGGVIGEILLRLMGKIGGSIICILALFGFSMLISHTTPVALIEGIRDGLKNGWNIITSMFREEIPQRIRSAIQGNDEEIFYSSDSLECSDNADNSDNSQLEYAIEPDDMLVVAGQAVDDISNRLDEPQLAEVKQSQNLADMSVGDLVKKVTQNKKKSKKKTKAEEIEEEKQEFAKQVISTESADTNAAEDDEYKYPTLRLLIASRNSDESDNRQENDETSYKLINTLAEYGVKASISNVSRGPTVTRYEVIPAPGVKINKITNLSNDIALRLAAQSIRIEAPIPGKPAVGIEIPNKNKQMVRIRDIIGSNDFIEAKGALVVALGKDIEGNIVLCDLSKMPHLLIAGSTGSGKSVCVNSMLISLLYKYSPKEVRMVLIDPKSVEFDMYNGIPHLLVPVVCEPKKAAGALQWAVSEMLKRYGMLKERGARNIDNYNRLVEETGEFEKLCRIVIVIDEMADLMIASPKEVEDAIARLAAMARAAGMYMVLATQRPSVDVITGTIKNNIPSRIALAVSSQIDSRTILDEGGAENLIGYGDMLYHPMGSSKHTRVQGCFVDDIEVDRVIKFVKQNGSAEYDDSIADEIERNSLDGSAENRADFSDKDEFFEKAVEVVTEAGQASTSMLQRRLGVGYARAGRIIDQLEEQGIIGPYEGSKPRAVLITRAQWLEMTMSRIPSGKNDPIVRSHSQFAAQTLDNGHEEITAKQSEFFNADNAQDEYIDYDMIENVEISDSGADDDEYIEIEYAEEQSEDTQESGDTDVSGDDIQISETGEDCADNHASDNRNDEFDELDDIEIIPLRVRDLTQFFDDSADDESIIEQSVDVSQDEVGSTGDKSENVDEASHIRDFTQFLDDSADGESIIEQSVDVSQDEVGSTGDKSENVDEASHIRDFTQFLDDSADGESIIEQSASVSQDEVGSTGDKSENVDEASHIRDFTQFFDDSADDEENTDLTAEESEHNWSDDNSGDDENVDLPPWDIPEELSKKPPLEMQTKKSPSTRDIFDDDDDEQLYNEILSSSWVKRLDNNKK